MSQTRWREVERAFQRAAGLEGGARRRLLEALERERPGLRAEVESLLRHADGPLTVLGRFDNLLRGAQPPIRPGDRLGVWRIGSIIGEGGSSVVFEADRADQRYERRVAVKVLKHALLTAEAIERFHRECRLLAKLEHPDIARLEDAGTTEQGLPYMVLERVDGVALDDWRRREPKLGARLDLFRRVCSAVAFAHRNLVVHRDLKPGNVLVTADGEPKLLDFGIARVLSDEPRTWSRLTGALVPMTPQYASPEQLRGEDVTTASDVYSLGLLLYELLTGRLPYASSDRSGATVRRLLEGTLRIPPPSAAIAGDLDGDLDADLDTIVLAALEPDADRRYPSAQALGDELDRFRRGLPIVARAPSPGYLLRRFVGRHRLAVAAGLAFVLLAFGFALMMGVAASRLRVEEARARTEAATAREAVAFLGGLFEGADPAFHQGRQLSARELLDRGAVELERREIDDPATRAAVGAAIGRAYLELSELAAARTMLEKALSWIDPDRHPGAAAEIHMLFARLEHAEANFDTAAGHARTAISLLEPLAAGRWWLAKARVLLGRSLMALGELDAGERALRAALARLDPARAPHDAAIVGLAELELGGALMKRGRWQQARPYIDRAIELLISAHGEHHPQVFEAQRLSYLLASILAPDQAPREPVRLLALLERQKRVYGQAHEQMMWTLTDIASAYTVLDRNDRAERYYQEALAMREALVADDHLVLAIVHAGLGHIARRRGALERAIEHYQRSLEISQRRFGAGSIDLAYPKMALGHALSRVGRCPEAETLLAQAHRAFDRERPKEDFNRIESQWAWGYALACNGDAAGNHLMWQSLAVAEARGWRHRETLRHDVEMWRSLTPPRPQVDGS